MSDLEINEVHISNYSFNNSGESIGFAILRDRILNTMVFTINMVKGECEQWLYFNLTNSDRHNIAKLFKDISLELSEGVAPRE